MRYSPKHHPPHRLAPLLLLLAALSSFTPLASCSVGSNLPHIDYPEVEIWSDIASARRWLPLADEAAASAASAAALRATRATLAALAAAAASSGDSSPETQQLLNYVSPVTRFSANCCTPQVQFKPCAIAPPPPPARSCPPRALLHTTAAI
jgi:hypothetical protein